MRDIIWNYLFIHQGTAFVFLLWIHLWMNFFLCKIEYGKFQKRFVEKMAGIFFYVWGVQLLFLLLTYSMEWLVWIYICFFSLVNVIEILLFLEYRSIINHNIFLVLLETNKKESSEFLEEIFSIRFFSYFIGALLFIYGGGYLLSAILFPKWIVYKSTQNIVFCISLVSLFSFLQSWKAKKRERYLVYLPFFRFIKEYKTAKAYLKESQMALEEQQKLEIHLKRAENLADTLVFILGESASRNHMGIYGSCFQNTPFAIEEMKKGNLFAFDNVISSESFTSASIPKMFTFKNYENTEEWYRYPNLISILKKAGYVTYWISNQSKNEIIGKLFSSFADHIFFADGVAEAGEAYDEILLQEGFSILENNPKRAIFIHLMGSHNSYVRRYPKQWDIDKKEDVKLLGKTDKMKKYIAEYSNSIRYTDFILGKIFQKFEQENALIFYASDHGEEMYEERNVRGHGGSSGSRYMIEIPMFVYAGQVFQKKYLALWGRFQKRLHTAYMTDDIIHTVIGSLGIDVQGYEASRDLFSKDFDVSRKRVFQGKDYDEYWLHQFE